MTMLHSGWSFYVEFAVWFMVTLVAIPVLERIWNFIIAPHHRLTDDLQMARSALSQLTRERERDQRVLESERASHTREIAGLVSERDALLDRMVPKFQIVFAPENESDSRPYLQTLEFLASAGVGMPVKQMRDRRYRIGVLNHSSAPISDVSAVLESCEPSGNFIHLQHRLLVMDSDPPIGSRDLPVSHDGRPKVFFDVVNEVRSVTKTPEHFFFCYAIDGIRGPVDSGVYDISIRVEAGGTAVSKRFRITKEWDKEHHEHRCLTMEAI
jgi:hypothetical protein